MTTYLFNYKHHPIRESFRVEARDLEAARTLLYFYIYLDDPFGHLVTMQCIINNHQVMEEAEAERGINEEIRSWGFSWLVRMMQ